MAKLTRTRKYSKYRSHIKKMKEPVLSTKESEPVSNNVTPTKKVNEVRPNTNDAKTLIAEYDKYINKDKKEPVVISKSEKLAKNISIFVLIFIGVILITVSIIFLIKKYG